MKKKKVIVPIVDADHTVVCGECFEMSYVPGDREPGEKRVPYTCDSCVRYRLLVEDIAELKKTFNVEEVLRLVTKMVDKRLKNL